MYLIIQNGYINTKIGEYLDDDIQIVESYNHNVLQININLYKCIIILGGPQSLTDLSKYPYLYAVIILIRHCLAIDKPVLGICLGCQMIAYALGYKIRKLPSLKIGYIYHPLNYKTSNIRLRNITFRYHNDYIDIFSNHVPGLDILSTYQGLVYIIKYKRAIGIQCHPDIPPQEIFKYVDNPQIVNFAQRYSNLINLSNYLLLHLLLILITY